MYVTKCDVCKKQVKGKPVVAGVDYAHTHLCEKCGKPILRFLKTKKLIEPTKKRK